MWINDNSDVVIAYKYMRKYGLLIDTIGGSFR